MLSPHDQQPPPSKQELQEAHLLQFVAANLLQVRRTCLRSTTSLQSIVDGARKGAPLNRSQPCVAPYTSLQPIPSEPVSCSPRESGGGGSQLGRRHTPSSPRG